MNPLHWKREHQLAWIIACSLGILIGLLIGFARSPLSGEQMAGFYFLLWLRQPALYWNWALIGAVIAALAFYLARLLKD